MNVAERYADVVLEQLRAVIETQTSALNQAATMVGDALIREQWVYVFGTGHSHMLAEEAFYRAGGLVRMVPILDTGLMLHEGAAKSSYLEGIEGYAETLLDQYPVRIGDVLIVASNSGRNAVPIDMALAGKSRKMSVIALTNLRHSKMWPSRHTSGKHLFECADIVIDNCGIPGDSSIHIDGLDTDVGATSTISGTLIMNMISLQAMEYCILHGKVPEVYVSSNGVESDHNARIITKYRTRIRHL
ncbi:MAG: SIS domain-containing protein [Acidibacillus sp.]|nr:SIS domain-containing protein [Acidibacillus sp.]